MAAAPLDHCYWPQPARPAAGFPALRAAIEADVAIIGGGIVGILAVIVAGATIWLLLTDPVTVAESVDTGEVSPVIRSLANVIYDALVNLLRFL